MQAISNLTNLQRSGLNKHKATMLSSPDCNDFDVACRVSKRKTSGYLDKENQTSKHMGSLQKSVKRLCLRTLSSNKLETGARPVEFTEKTYTDSLISASKSLDLCLFSQNSQDSQDSGLGLSQHLASPYNHDLNTSIELEQSDMDQLNSYCLQNSAFNNRMLNSSLSLNDSTARRCLFKSSPMPSSALHKTPNKMLFNDDSFSNSPVRGARRQITPVSVRRRNSMRIEPVPAMEDFSTFAEQSIKSIEKMLDDTSCLKSHHDQIKKSLDIECQQSSDLVAEPQTSTNKLIGDRSKYHILPTVTSIKHNDLNVITSATCKRVLNGEYSSEIDSVMVIDSRYPYEFEGGHIQTAENLYTKEQVFEKFLGSDKLKKMTEKANSAGKRAVIIFHCEFSSERGPSMLRFLRNQDRTLNKDSYPKLFYPELYLLEGGYKAFYEQNSEHCEPMTYKPMLHKDHVSDLKHFRAKTKTWNRLGSINMSANKNCYKSRLQRFPRSTLF